MSRPIESAPIARAGFDELFHESAIGLIIYHARGTQIVSERLCRLVAGVGVAEAPSVNDSPVEGVREARQLLNLGRVRAYRIEEPVFLICSEQISAATE
ncbi:hypothetical protein [Bradyrhizobium sp. UNPF46]|uniref:hypothetical protein n=1 Tax=Bradyrhizobium sp. UNPF46 TaxID=1141168 RepID=UPI001FEDEEB6|nr:hypothetical protein [Bradyrhizobium sp. UNPF46]